MKGFSCLVATNLLTTSCIFATTFDEAEQSLFLSLHNDYRSQVASGGLEDNPGASNMNELFWDSALAQVASSYAEQCIYAHNSERVSDINELSLITSFTFDSNDGIGENIFARSFRKSTSELSEAITDGMEAMFEEYEDYDYSTNSCKNNKECGHYKQIVTANTRYVGCGYYVCDDIENLSSNYDIIVVCNYYPSAKTSSSPYEEMEGTNGCEGNASSEDDEFSDSNDSNSGCDSDRWCNSDTKLCSGCMAKSYNYCMDRSSDCSKYSKYCSGYGCVGNKGSTFFLCTLCRDTCNVCDDSEELPPCECDEYPQNYQMYPTCDTPNSSSAAL